jgi:hypothetical protein
MSPATWHEAENRSTHYAKQSLPVTGALWLALLRFSGGEWNVSAAELDVLLSYGLIRKEGDATVLTSYGRQVLELSS